jgi:hypothetical protein
MKKIITLLFFVGFLTSAFAQPDRRHQYGSQTSDNRSQSSKYSGDNNYVYDKSYHDNNECRKNNQWNKRNNDNEYGYNRERDGDRDRDDMRRNQYHHPQYGEHKRNDYYPDRTRPKVSLFKIIFGVSGILK